MAVMLRPAWLLSSRSVRKLFEAEGTSLSDFMLCQRLVRAHRMLGDPTGMKDLSDGQKDETIAAIDEQIEG